MRTYTTTPGNRSRFLDVFRATSVPAHRAAGMTIAGPFLSVDDPDTFFFMRDFRDEESREPSKARFYEGFLWKEELEGALMPMLERYDVVIVNDPEGKIAW